MYYTPQRPTSATRTRQRARRSAAESTCVEVLVGSARCTRSHLIGRNPKRIQPKPPESAIGLTKAPPLSHHDAFSRRDSACALIRPPAEIDSEAHTSQRQKRGGSPRADGDRQQPPKK